MTPTEEHLLARARSTEKIVTVVLGAVLGPEHPTVTEWRTVVAAREAEAEKLRKRGWLHWRAR
jgi:hypothetical protein